MRYNRVVRAATIATTVGAAAFGYGCFASSASAATAGLSGNIRNAQGQPVGRAQVQLSAFAVDQKGVHEITIEKMTSDVSGHYTPAAPASAVYSTSAKTRSAALFPQSGGIDLTVKPLHLTGGALAHAKVVTPKNCTNNQVAWGTVSMGRMAPQARP